MRIAFFGRLADVSGTRTLEHKTEALTGEDLRRDLAAAHPQIADILNHGGTRLVLNDEIVGWDSPLAEDDDVAIIPVVSGG